MISRYNGTRCRRCDGHYRSPKAKYKVLDILLQQDECCMTIIGIPYCQCDECGDLLISVSGLRKLQSEVRKHAVDFDCLHDIELGSFNRISVDFGIVKTKRERKSK